MSWNNITPAWLIEMDISVRDCCRAELVRNPSSPSFWECRKCKLTCAAVKKENDGNH